MKHLKIAILIGAACLSMTGAARAQVPVIDAATLSQATTTAANTAAIMQSNAQILTATNATPTAQQQFYRVQRTSPPAVAVEPMVQNLTTAVGTTAEATFYVTNTGRSALTGSAAIWYGGVVTNGFFSVVSGTNFNLAAGQSQAVVVSYSPTVVETSDHCALWVHGPAGNIFATVLGSVPTNSIAAVGH